MPPKMGGFTIESASNGKWVEWKSLILAGIFELLPYTAVGSVDANTCKALKLVSPTCWGLMSFVHISFAGLPPIRANTASPTLILSDVSRPTRLWNWNSIALSSASWLTTREYAMRSPLILMKNSASKRFPALVRYVEGLFPITLIAAWVKMANGGGM